MPLQLAKLQWTFSTHEEREKKKPVHSGQLDVGLQLPVITSNHSGRQGRCVPCLVHFFISNTHLRNAAMALKLAGPNMWPLCSRVCVAGSELEEPGAIVADEEASYALEAVCFHRGVVFKSGDLRKKF